MSERDRSETPDKVIERAERTVGIAVPSVGRIVHRATAGGECMAAIVVQVKSDIEVNLTVFDMDGVTHPEENVTYGDWHWPERNAS